ncbi:MAG TPA: vitamin K epoxide reductase family protein [Baekduia sp.]|nr:vitamin K epoxide reductase family protein [Baekduia sp.]
MSAPLTSRTREADWLRWLASGLALLGICIAAYLTYVHYDDAQVLCTGGGGCEKVQKSEYSKLAGVPVALMGLLGYIAIFAASWIRSEAAALAAAGLAIGGAGFSYYLQYRSFVTLDAHCVWCMGSAAVMTVLALVTTIRALRYPT